MAQYVLGERAAEAVRQLMAGDSSVGRVKATVPTPVDPVEFPAPWYIEWSASEDSGNGSWVIWLPAESFKSEKSAYETAFTTMRGSMTACTSRPSGWYRISKSSSSGSVMYLTIDTSSGSSTPTMAIEDDVSKSVMIPLAYLERDTTSGEVTVKQYQAGVMVYGSDGSGSGTNIPGCFELTISQSSGMYSGSFSNQYYRIAGKTYAASLSPSLTDGIMCLVIDTASTQPSPSIATYASFAAMQTAEQDLSKFICPLYTIASNAITCDWRKGAICAMTEF